jgi:hypothetical protein
MIPRDEQTLNKPEPRTSSTKSKQFHTSTAHKLNVEKRQQNQRTKTTVKPQGENKKPWKNGFQQYVP